jgi:hypothetical protein
MVELFLEGALTVPLPVLTRINTNLEHTPFGWLRQSRSPLERNEREGKRRPETCSATLITTFQRSQLPGFGVVLTALQQPHDPYPACNRFTCPLSSALL